MACYNHTENEYRESELPADVLAEMEMDMEMDGGAAELFDLLEDWAADAGVIPALPAPAPAPPMARAMLKMKAAPPAALPGGPTGGLRPGCECNGPGCAFCGAAALAREAARLEARVQAMDDWSDGEEEAVDDRVPRVPLAAQPVRSALPAQMKPVAQSMEELEAELGLVTGPPSKRRKRILRRWRQKRATLNFSRKTRYHSRARVASTRLRIGGRFVKDPEPLSQGAAAGVAEAAVLFI